MRSLSPGLLAAQKAATRIPFVSINIVRPAGGGWMYDTFGSEAGRTLSVIQTEGAFSGGAVIQLSNSDKLLNGIDYTGCKAYIKWGLRGSFGEGGAGDYSSTAPMCVWSQRNLSEEGELVVELVCIDMWERIARAIIGKETAARARPGWPGDTTVKDIIIGLLDNLDINLIVDSEDLQITTYKPDYYVDVNTPVRDVIRELLGMTNCAIRWAAVGGDGAHLIHLQPGDPIDYQYGGDHKFYSSDVQEKAAPSFNFVIVQNREPEDAIDAASGTFYQGSAEDAASVAKFGLIPQIITLDWVKANYEAQVLANTWLNRSKNEAVQGTMLAPMNCGQEVHDVVRIVDSRSGQTVVGRVGQITRVFTSGQYTIELQFGGLASAGFIAPVSSLIGVTQPRLGPRLLPQESPRLLPIMQRTAEEEEAQRKAIREMWKRPSTPPRVMPPKAGLFTPEERQEMFRHNPSSAVIRGTTGLLGEPSQILRAITGLTPYPMVPPTPRGAGGYTTHEVFSPHELRLIGATGLKLKALSGHISVLLPTGGKFILVLNGTEFCRFEKGIAGWTWITTTGGGLRVDGALYALTMQTPLITATTVYADTVKAVFDVIPGENNSGSIGYSTNYWKYVYSNYIYYKNLNPFQGHNDIALVKGMKPHKDDKNIIDPKTAKIIRGELKGGQDGDPGYDIGKSFGLVFGTLQQLIDRVEKLEKGGKK